MSYNTLIVFVDDGVATVTLNRPAVLNALNEELYTELDAVVVRLEASKEVRAIIFTGSGVKAFSAGADIHEMAAKVSEQKSDLPHRTKNQERRSWRIASTKIPTIGAINGLAYGGGAVLASSLDIRVGCEHSSFRFLAAAYGRVNATWSLPMQVGWPVAKELLFTARVINAEESLAIGLLNHLVPCAQLTPFVTEMAKDIARNDPRMIGGIKELLIKGVGSEWLETYEAELEAREGHLKPTPVIEGFKEFLSRKEPRG